MARARMADGSTARIRRTGTQPSQWLAALAALALLVIGIVGFGRTGVADWSASNTVTLIGFHLNAVRNLVYVIAGVVGVLLALLAGTSRLYGWLLVIGFAVLVLWGLALVGTFASNPVSGLGNPLRLAASDNWWHIGGVVLGLLVAVLPARRVIVTDEVAAEDRPADAGMAPVDAGQAEPRPTRRGHWWTPRRRDPGYR